MPSDEQEPPAPRDRPAAAAKKPGDAAKAKGAGREARLAEALRANLRRRKADKTTDRPTDWEND